MFTDCKDLQIRLEYRSHYKPYHLFLQTTATQII